MADAIYLAGIVGGVVLLGLFYWRFFDIVLDPRPRPPRSRGQDVIKLALLPAAVAVVGVLLLIIVRRL